MLTQLNPYIPVITDKGKAMAIAIIDYSQEHHLIWVCAQDETGEIWAVPNPKVRFQANFTMDRLPHKQPSHPAEPSAKLFA